MTRSCALKCLHCRAEAVSERDPRELSTDEAYRLLREARRFGQPVVVLTGGDPLRRSDAPDIVEYGAGLGLKMALTPSGTREVTPEILITLKKKGLSRLAVSLDGSTEKIHDGFRRVEGSYQWTLAIIRWANQLGLPVQINTTLTRHNLGDIDALFGLLSSLKIALWSVFFLVPVGRGKLEDGVRGRDYERLFHKMVEFSKDSAFDIKSTEAPHYRRVVVQSGKKNGAHASACFGGTDPSSCDATGGIGRASKGVNDGNGFVFISHTGEIFPSGFLPLAAGNVREDSLVEVYRHSDLFRQIRDTSRLKGKCGVCEYRSICGGSRARAFAVQGDMMASDLFCVHVPKGYQVSDEEMKFW
ncbi:MAG: TIGR04053 family radical SAM/SPASM domain-containing protein [Candidatus Omnitrophica bacterium]|nr:TIGR04053 family radical SAM/SPASM domain-containing protein [Candidatus Omnitrophota bacterium]